MKWTIEAPISRQLGAASPTLITYESSRQVKAVVEKLGYYFKRELQFDFPPYEASEAPGAPWGYTRYEAWLFHEDAYEEARGDDDEPRRVVGVACFRWREWENASHGWALQWAWMHPYRRRHGLLREAWPSFEARYPRFEVEEPLSLAMSAALKVLRP